VVVQELGHAAVSGRSPTGSRTGPEASRAHHDSLVHLPVDHDPHLGALAPLDHLSDGHAPPLGNCPRVELDVVPGEEVDGLRLGVRVRDCHRRRRAAGR
jgi:hypothetical protein